MVSVMDELLDFDLQSHLRKIKPFAAKRSNKGPLHTTYYVVVRRSQIPYQDTYPDSEE